MDDCLCRKFLSAEASSPSKDLNSLGQQGPVENIL